MTTPDNTAVSEAAANAARAEKKPPKTFIQTLGDIHYGHFGDECTDALHECIEASERTGKATKLTITIDIKPVSKASGRYNVLADVKAKLPAKEVEPALMFVGPDMNLTTRDPKQPDLPGIRVVENQRPAIRPQDNEQQQPGIRVG